MTTTKPLTLKRKIRLIEQSGWPLAFDGCHKIYFLQDAGREAQAREFGYGIFPSTDLREIWEDSCSLRFVSRWGYDNGDFDHPWNIDQFEKR